MRVPRTRGAVSGILLVLLGAWVALIPFVGPIFDYSIGSTASWDWSWGRLWLNILPGAAAVLAGLMLLGAGRRGSLGTAAWIATVAGIWTVIGWEISRVWNNGLPESGLPFGGTNRQVLEMLGYYLASGAAITAIGAFALGRSTLATVDDMRYDEEHRRRAYDDRLESASVGGSPDRPVVDARDRDRDVEDDRRPVEAGGRTHRHHLFGRRDDHEVDLRQRLAEREQADAEDRSQTR